MASPIGRCGATTLGTPPRPQIAYLDDLSLKWYREESPRLPVWDDPLNRDLMPYDRVFEPIAADGRIYLPYNDSDKVVCFSLGTGDVEWTYFADGPVRFPPVAANGKIYCVSDDGWLHCLDGRTGKVVWKHQGGPTDRKVLGNERIISMWPARGGPVVRDGAVYYAASIWPFLGTFMYALDADSGEVIWVNDETSAQYIKQPHSAESFAGVAPQGALAVTDHYVIVPGGRSVPAVLRRDTGELVHFHLNEGGKGAGGSTVIANDRHLYVHTRLRGVRRFDLASGVKTEVMLNEPVLHDRVAYTSTAEAISAVNVDKEVVWEVAADGRHDLIRAGQRLYAAGDGGITVLASDDLLTQAPTVAQHIPIDGTPVRLVAASRHLVVVTQEGSILVFGDADDANVAADSATRVAEGGRRSDTSRPTDVARRSSLAASILIAAWK